MSRIGKKPIAVPAGVTAIVNGQTVSATGPKGQLRFGVTDEVLGKTAERHTSAEFVAFLTDIVINQPH